MKTSHDPRHQHRIALVKSLFAYDFQKLPDDDIAAIVARLDEIDEYIKKAATEHPINSMNKIDLAILRVGVFELIEKEVKVAIIIDEAVEIAKEYGADNSSKFVHGVLNTIAGQVQSSVS